MHPQKVLLDVIGATEGLVADVAVKGLLLAVDVLVACVEVPPVGAVRTIEARVPLAAGVAVAAATTASTTCIARSRCRRDGRRQGRCGRHGHRRDAGILLHLNKAPEWTCALLL